MSLALANVTPIRPELRAVEQRVADTDDGYTRLANELYEELIGANLTRNQAKVAHAVCRKTYGFNKKMDRIADSQISQLTRLPRQKVNKAKNELIQMGVLVREGMLIGPNKNLAAWQIPECHQDGVTVTKTVTKGVTKTVTALSPKQGHTKDTITKDKKDIKHTSENSGESSDERLKSLPVVRPDAAVHSPRGDKWGTADDLLAAQWIFSRVQVITPTAQQPNWPAWANDIRLMRESLTVSHREICEVFTWANGNQFWQTNILSPSKLRKQWATLKAQMSQPARNAPSSSQQQVPHWNDRREWEENFI
ncbi:replication protein [Pantoea sp. ACRSB]|uniref:replication protein n=1 Tax=Pantoea sp. ACRSB TaxID=2918207 RepID=UPI002892FE2C|nr:replication protein [Pantoea sp. ACRSB]MCG7388327.1 replication protein [Pantoea sp. ACRSB]